MKSFEVRYHNLINRLQKQYNEALNGKAQGSWILEVEDLENWPIEFGNEVYANLHKALEAIPNLDDLSGGMRGRDVEPGISAIRFEA